MKIKIQTCEAGFKGENNGYTVFSINLNAHKTTQVSGSDGLARDVFFENLLKSFGCKILFLTSRSDH